MIGRFRHPGPVLPDLSVRPDPDGRPDDPDRLAAVHHLLAERTVGLHHLAVRIGQQREGQPVFPDEAEGILAVDPEEKLAETWGSIKSGF